MLLDLRDAGRQHGWIHCVGDCLRIGEHHWIESGDWSIDASHGDRRAVLGYAFSGLGAVKTSSRKFGLLRGGRMFDLRESSP